MKKTENVKIPRKPLLAAYWLAAGIMKIYLKLFFNLKIQKQAIKGLKDPFVVLGNHPSGYDAIITGLACLPHRINFMAGAFLFQSRLMTWVMKLAGAVPKAQMTSDISSVMTMMRLAKAKRNIGIFPEGRRSNSGEGVYIQPSIAKMLKKLGLPVVVVKINGAWLSLPRWTTKRRKGKTEAVTSLLFTAQQLKSAPVEEIYEKICKALYYNDYEWQREHG